MAALTLEPIRMTKVPSSTSGTPLRNNEKSHNYKYKESADPLKVLEPERKKLTSLESQRVLAVLNDTIRRIEVATILPFVIENLNRFSIVLGSDLTQLLREHDVLQGQYQKASSVLHLDEKRLEHLRENFAAQNEQKDVEFFLDDIDESRDDTQKNEDRVGSLEITLAEGKVQKAFKQMNLLKAQLQQSLRSLLRHFVKNTAALDTFRNENKERSEQANEMLRELHALKSSLFERLLRTPSEMKEKESYLKFITQREVKLRKHATKLQEELRLATEDKENELLKRTDIIDKLRCDIFNVERTSKESNEQVINESKKERLAEEKNSEAKKLKLQQEILEQRKLIEASVTKHRESELALRKKKYKVETEVENWIQKYDNDMGERQDELDQLDKIYTDEKKQLNELEERFRTLEKEYSDIMEARKIAREKAEEANRQLQIKIKAATLIQSFWRAFKARKQLRNKKKKGKKGAKKRPRY